MEKKNLAIFGAAFLDGFSLAGFLAPLRRPGAPTQLFADPEPIQRFGATDPVEIQPELEKAKRLLKNAGFQVIPGAQAHSSER